jgi:hypothetical protein
MEGKRPGNFQQDCEVFREPMVFPTRTAIPKPIRLDRLSRATRTNTNRYERSSDAAKRLLGARVKIQYH